MVDKEHPLITSVKEQFAEGKMNRREFLRDATLLGLSAAAAYAFVGKVTGVEYVPHARAASMPKGGTMRLGHPVHAEIADPAVLSWPPHSNITFPVHQTLTRTGADNITRPHLCESWEPNEDLTSWTVKLRKDAKWSDGSALTSDDVIAVFERLMDPATGSNAVGAMSYLLKDVEKDGETRQELWDANALERVDDHTVRFNLKVPQVAVPEHLFHYTNGITDPKHDFAFGPGKNGSGPYDCVEYEPESGRIVIEAKRGYWGREGYLDRVEFIDLGPDPNARFAALASKQVHGVEEIEPEQIEALEGQSHLMTYSVPTGRCVTLSLRNDHEPWGDNRIRQAMKLAVNAKHATLVSLGPIGTPGEHHLISPIHPEYVKLPDLATDAAGAKKMLAEAGHPDGIEAEMSILAEPAWMVTLGQALKAQLEPAGITLNLKPATMDAFWGMWDVDVVTLTWWSHRPLGIQLLALILRSGVPWNTFRWSNKEFDDTLTKAEGTVDIGERKRLVKRMEEILQAEGPMLQPVFVNAVTSLDKRVKGFSMHPFYSIYVEDLALEA